MDYSIGLPFLMVWIERVFRSIHIESRKDKNKQ